MRPSMSWLFAGAALAPIVLASPSAAAVHRFHDDHVLGASLDFAIVGVDAAEAAQALIAARSEIGRLDAVLSGWRPDSELARLNASTGPVAVSEDLFRVIERCEAWRTACDGAFSARLGRTEALWKAAEQTNAAPHSAGLAETARRDEAAPVSLDPAARTIDRAGVTFAIDALAKGYIIDAAVEAARRAAPGASGLMIDIGGDLRCIGAGPASDGWRIGVADGRTADNARPAQLIAVSDVAVATSGRGPRDRHIDGCAYAHTLSPAGGQPIAESTVTVIAPKAADADALATALSVMPVDHGLALASSLTGVEARIVAADGVEHRSAGWDAYLIPLAAAGPTSRAPTKAALNGAAWPAGFDVEIQYEIPQLSLGRYRPPFVAIWITDQRGALVRTLFHLGTRPRRFLNSNYIWWRAFGGDDPSALDRLDTVTRPTRQPGRYTAVWDGKDDAGQPVGQGRYTINIETTREHGDHSYQTIPLDLGSKPVSGSAPAGTEAGPAAARYGRNAAI